MGRPVDQKTDAIPVAGESFFDMPLGTKVIANLGVGMDVSAELSGVHHCLDGKMRIECKGPEGRVFLLFNEHIRLPREGELS
jgi:hypothetical protein